MQIIPLNLDSGLLFLHNSKLAYYPLSQVSHDHRSYKRNSIFETFHISLHILCLLTHLYALSNIWKGDAFLQQGVTSSVVLHFD